MQLWDYPGYDWQAVASGDPWDIMTHWDDMRQFFGEGDHGLVRMEMRTPLSQEQLQWLDGLLRSVTDGIEGTIRQIGNVLHIPFVVGGWPALAAAFLAGAAFVLVMCTRIDVLKGIKEFVASLLSPEMLLVGGALLIWLLS